MYLANEKRYGSMRYTRCGRSGLKLPALSLGLWHNFGNKDNFENMQAMCRTAFDAGITHFDLANNYGPVGGSAEENFGVILKKDLASYRDELIIATKAGYYMWEGPYGDWGSRKYLIASADASLKRMGLDYVDIFYHHRPDPETPMEETMLALDTIVKSGRALYAGLSNYSSAQSEKAASILTKLNCPFVINQSKYSLMDRHIEADGLMASAAKTGYGIIAFCPLAQGLLTGKYLNGVPEDSRIRRDNRFLHESDITEERLIVIRALNALAGQRGQTLAQMALAWTLREGGVTSALIGASRPAQITENVQALDAAPFTREELDAIEKILA
jgi:L-glyceraldehyde 3-phosphate reductase